MMLCLTLNRNEVVRRGITLLRSISAQDGSCHTLVTIMGRLRSHVVSRSKLLVSFSTSSC